MADKYGVVRLDNVGATTDGSYLRTFRYFGAGGANDPEIEIENGTAIALKGLLTNERECYKGVTPTATETGSVVITCSPELVYDETTKKFLWDFINVPGGVAPRGFIPKKGDIFSVTKLDGTKAKGDVVVLQNSTILNSATSAGGNTVIGNIIDIETVGQLVYYVIEV